jgi:hypothetical protein
MPLTDPIRCQMSSLTTRHPWSVITSLCHPSFQSKLLTVQSLQALVAIIMPSCHC